MFINCLQFFDESLNQILIKKILLCKKRMKKRMKKIKKNYFYSV